MFVDEMFGSASPGLYYPKGLFESSSYLYRLPAEAYASDDCKRFAFLVGGSKPLPSGLTTAFPTHGKVKALNSMPILKKGCGSLNWRGRSSGLLPPDVLELLPRSERALAFWSTTSNKLQCVAWPRRTARRRWRRLTTRNSSGFG